jgi:hypothetical protein
MMKKFYRYIDIPNLTTIVEELSKFYNLDNLNKNKAESWIYNYNSVREELPNLAEFLRRSKVRVHLLKFYSIPPNGILGHHSDGPIDGSSFCPPFTFNIPLLNCNNTYVHYFDCEPSNLKILDRVNVKNGLVQEGFMGSAYVPINKSKITEIVKAEVNKPIIIKTDMVHSASNPNENTFRVIAGIRFDLRNALEFEDIFDTTGLRIDPIS